MQLKNSKKWAIVTDNSAYIEFEKEKFSNFFVIPLMMTLESNNDLIDSNISDDKLYDLLITKRERISTSFTNNQHIIKI
jgi:fatty acid-binding protein DegV